MATIIIETVQNGVTVKNVNDQSVNVFQGLSKAPRAASQHVKGLIEDLLAEESEESEGEEEETTEGDE
jgi:hypothetical protein